MTVIQRFDAGLPQLPTDENPGMLPVRWATFVQWQRQPEDDGTTYEQRIELFSPAGRVLIGQVSEFVMQHRFHRHNGGVFGFPITTAGEYTLRLSLRRVGDGEVQAVVADYPIEVSLQLTSVLEGTADAANRH